MSKFEEAVKLSFEEWSKRMDKEIAEAEARGELPHKTPEECKAEANAIWQKAHAIEEQEL